jgi:uncharacterized integral membrane protein
MKILSRALFLVFILLAVLVAVSNSQSVQLALWPLPHLIVLPLYLMVIVLLLMGVLVGLGIGWWAGRRYRRRAREQTNEAARLDREVARLRDALQMQRSASPAATGPLPREQRAMDRQSALVAPELAQPTTRGPFS